MIVAMMRRRTMFTFIAPLTLVVRASTRAAPSPLSQPRQFGHLGAEARYDDVFFLQRSQRAQGRALEFLFQRSLRRGRARRALISKLVVSIHLDLFQNASTIIVAVHRLDRLVRRFDDVFDDVFDASSTTPSTASRAIDPSPRVED